MSTMMTPEAPASATPPADPTPNAAPPAPPAPPAGTPPSGETPPAPPAAPVVPETYTLALADGSPLDVAFLDRASSLAKELQLTTNEGAQRIVDAVASELTTHVEAIRAADAPNGIAWKERVAQYERDALADPDLGAGDRAKLDAVAQRARLVAEKVGGKEILEFLGTTGMGSSAPFLKMFGVTLYKMFGEGEIVQPNAAGRSGSKDPADVLYGGKPATTKE